MLSLFLVPGGEAAALQRVPLPGRGQGKPHSEYFGSTGQRVEDSPFLLISIGKIGLCFGDRVMGTEDTLFDSGPADFLQNNARVEVLVGIHSLSWLANIY